MEDQELMEKELLIIKGACDLYLHATIESTTAETHSAFKDALNQTLDVQNKLYNLMAEKGWYKTELADQSKIECAKQSAQSN